MSNPQESKDNDIRTVVLDTIVPRMSALGLEEVIDNSIDDSDLKIQIFQALDQTYNIITNLLTAGGIVSCSDGIVIQEGLNHVPEDISKIADERGFWITNMNNIRRRFEKGEEELESIVLETENKSSSEQLIFLSPQLAQRIDITRVETDPIAGRIAMTLDQWKSSIYKYLSNTVQKTFADKGLKLVLANGREIHGMIVSHVLTNLKGSEA